MALVVAFHLQLRGSGGGFIGVDVFFVISGYLMTQIIWGGLSQGDFGYWRFVAARAARIWPALGAMVCTLLVLGAFLLPPFDLKIVAEQALPALTFWSNQFFHDRSGYNTQSVDTHWLLHTWSLSVEWQFYLLYPPLLMATTRLKTPGRLMLLLTLLAASLGCQLAMSASHPASAFFLLPSRAWEMLAGGLVYLAEARGRPTLSARLRAAISHGGLALVLLGALWLGVRHIPAEGAGWPLVLPVLGVALILWARHAGRFVLGHPLMQKLGLWSYSIYLWHWPLLVGLRMTDAFLDHPKLAALGVAVASVLCGALSYRVVESASGTGWRRLRVPLLCMGLAAGMTALVGATQGLAFRSKDPGFYERYTASVRPLYFPERCSNFMKTAEETQVCAVPGEGRRRVLVIGDSHAEHLYPWFVAHSRVSVDFFTQAECPPVPNFERVQNGFHCADYARAAWLKAASADYDTLVLAARWANVGLDGAPYCHASGTNARCVFTGVPQKQALIRAELQAAIESLLSKGKRVVMVMPTPEARVRVPERIAREQFWFGQTRLVIEEASIGELTGWLMPLFDAMKGQPGFHPVDLNGRLCAAGVCQVYDTGLKRPIYVDDSHFDPVWIATNGGAFAPFVQP
ncbi:acyltransferase family protein [Sphaerotilaceae bacterium SBD11-9]